MKQALHLQLSQQLNLSPQLKQSLRLLQLPSMELEQEIQTMLDTNPLLERIESETPVDDAIPTGELNADNNLPQPISEASDPSFEIEQNDHLAPEQDLALSLQESYSQPSPASAPSASSNADAAELMQYAKTQETLFEHLNWQVQMTSLSDKDKLIARTILRSLDDEGYLGISLYGICEIFDPDLMIEEDEVAAVLSLIKTLEPIGAGAHDLSDRLLILLNQLPDETIGLELAKLIVSDHIDLLATRNLSKLKKKLSVNDTTLSQSLELITDLNPRIAAPYTAQDENYITPDVLVKKHGNKWKAELNADNQSRLRVNQTYSDLLKSDIAEADSEFIQQNLNDAKSFIKGLMSRYDTLLLVAQSIVERQQEFFEHGADSMQPMVLNDIAETLEMHESTISRATSGKYLTSPQGVYELKYFFSSALTSTEGTATSSTAIRSLIKKMVEAESKTKPLSDSKIAKALEQQGHIVARRTVAKYRESMHIAPSSQRKSLVQ